MYYAPGLPGCSAHNASLYTQLETYLGMHCKKVIME